MRAFFCVMVCGAIVALASAPPRAQPRESGAWGGYVSGIADLPLVAGLTEDVEAALVFDKPSGRIIEAFATGALTRAEVTAFYARTLPELGWRRLDDSVFAREREVLRILVSGDNGTVAVRFLLSPR